jgi:hypothetical protein
MPAAEEPRQNGAHHSEAASQGKPPTGIKRAVGHGSCIAMQPLGIRRGCSSNINSILDYSRNTFYIMPSI